MSKPIKVYMGIPSTGDRVDSQSYALRVIEKRYADQVELVYPKDCVQRIFHDAARNAIVEEFLASDCDVLWFLDSDICPPPHVIELVTKHWDKWEAAGAPYPIWMRTKNGEDPKVVYTAYKGIIEGQGIQLSSVPKEGFDELDALATGCLFLKRSVFDGMSKPYFEFKYEKETMKLIEGEDLGFCLKLAKRGIKFFTDYGSVCKHYKRVCLLEVQNYATEWANSKVMEYDAEIKRTVAPALEAAKQKGFMAGFEAAQKELQSKKTSPGGLILPAGF